jgi:DNA-binding protein HU-beta
VNRLDTLQTVAYKRDGAHAGASRNVSSNVGGGRMNKQELIEKVVKETGATKALAGKVLESAMENIGKTLKKGDTITFVGFGTFKTSVRKARTARNPRTGEPIKIAKRRVPRFTAGKALKDLVK